MESVTLSDSESENELLSLQSRFKYLHKATKNPLGGMDLTRTNLPPNIRKLLHRRYDGEKKSDCAGKQAPTVKNNVNSISADGSKNIDSTQLTSRTSSSETMASTGTKASVHGTGNNPSCFNASIDSCIQHLVKSFAASRSDAIHETRMTMQQNGQPVTITNITRVPIVTTYNASTCSHISARNMDDVTTTDVTAARETPSFTINRDERLPDVTTVKALYNLNRNAEFGNNCSISAVQSTSAASSVSSLLVPSVPCWNNFQVTSSTDVGLHIDKNTSCSRSAISTSDNDVSLNEIEKDAQHLYQKILTRNDKQRKEEKSNQFRKEETLMKSKEQAASLPANQKDRGIDLVRSQQSMPTAASSTSLRISQNKRRLLFSIFDQLRKKRENQTGEKSVHPQSSSNIDSKKSSTEALIVERGTEIEKTETTIDGQKQYTNESENVQKEDPSDALKGQRKDKLSSEEEKKEDRLSSEKEKKKDRLHSEKEKKEDSLSSGKGKKEGIANGILFDDNHKLTKSKQVKRNDQSNEKKKESEADRIDRSSSSEQANQNVVKNDKLKRKAANKDESSVKRRRTEKCKFNI